MRPIRAPYLTAVLAAVSAGGLLATGDATAQLACNLRAVQPVLFGAYSPLAVNPLDAQSSFTVRCTGLGIALLRMQMGPGLAGTVSARQMQQGPHRLNYGLFTNGARTSAWGDGTGGTTTVLRLVFTGLEFTQQVYGRIPPAQNVPVGAYTDQLILGLDF
jgi:spore coat protein U-like protein